MDFPRIYSDYGACEILAYFVSILRGIATTILFVHLLDFEDISALVDAVPVEFIPSGKCCEFWTRDFGKRMEYKAEYRNSKCESEETRYQSLYHYYGESLGISCGSDALAVNAMAISRLGKLKGQGLGVRRTG